MPRKRTPETEPPVSQVVAPVTTSLKGSKAAPAKGSAVTRQTRKRIVGKPAPAPQDLHISHEEIARLAYSYWEARQSPHPSAEDDWYRAERELRSTEARSQLELPGGSRDPDEVSNYPLALRNREVSRLSLAAGGSPQPRETT